jgi:uncharacterized protein YjiK
MPRSLHVFRLIFFLFVVAVYSCNLADKSKYPDVPGYDIHNPVTIKLKTELDEISGIFYFDRDTCVFAVNDELGVLYKIYLRKKITIDEWEFSEDADYEDLVLVDSMFYALHSNGDITKFRYYSEDSLFVDEIPIPLEGKNEFEGLYYDSAANKLMVICKDCKGDKEFNSVYGFNLSSAEFTAEPVFKIDGKEVIKTQLVEEKRFKPSAAAIHPVTGDVYIVSSVNKCIAIADKHGKIKTVYPLNPAVFKQPEGITFTPDGDMLISNEAADVGVGNVLIYKYKPQGR